MYVCAWCCAWFCDVRVHLSLEFHFACTRLRHRKQHGHGGYRRDIIVLAFPISPMISHQIPEILISDSTGIPPNH